ncbi:hypothetical protein ABIE09_002196 [Lysobacter enzymogenes]|uniref:hypothetical protein n=1 Tax=Lysobacter enzymogenes TaxID=69 RepID=UPI003391627F
MVLRSWLANRSARGAAMVCAAARGVPDIVTSARRCSCDVDRIQGFGDAHPLAPTHRGLRARACGGGESGARLVGFGHVGACAHAAGAGSVPHAHLQPQRRRLRSTDAFADAR